MGEIISDDVVEWARDLAAINSLFAGEEAQQPLVRTPATILVFVPRQPLHGPLAASLTQVKL